MQLKLLRKDENGTRKSLGGLGGKYNHLIGKWSIHLILHVSNPQMQMDEPPKRTSVYCGAVLRVPVTVGDQALRRCLRLYIYLFITFSSGYYHEALLN